MNRTSPFALQTDPNQSTMSPILQCDISDKMTITSIKHKTIKNHHKFRRNKDSDLHHDSFKLNELNSSRKIASIIHETEDNIHEILKLNASTEDIQYDPSYHHHHHHRYRSSSHRSHKISKPSRHSSAYHHANSHREPAVNHAPYTKHSLHSLPKRTPPAPPSHAVFLDEVNATQSNEKRKRGKKRKRDMTHSEDTDDTMSSSHHSTQPRKRRKKSVDKVEKNKRHRNDNNTTSSSFSSSSSCSSSSSASSSSSYHAKAKRSKKKSKENHRTKKRKRDHSESDDNRKKEKHKEEKEESEQKTQHELHLSPSPSLSISSLTKQNIKRAQSPSYSSFTSKSRSRSRSKTRSRKHNNSNYSRSYHNPSSYSNTDAISVTTPLSLTSSRSHSTHSTSSSSSNSSSASSNSSSTETTDDHQSMPINAHKPKRKRKIIRERGRYSNKTRHISSNKRHYESHSTHNHDKKVRDTDTESESCSSDTESSSTSSSSTSSSENTEASDMQAAAHEIKNKKRDRRYRASSTTSSSKDRHKDAQKLPTTRNLLLTGRFYFERMNEEEITREIRYRFESDKLQVEFWKYTIHVDGKSFCRHLDCISVSFETSQKCQDKLSRFVEGFIDLSVVGSGINVSLDQYKSRAKKYHDKHVKKKQEIAQKILGKQYNKIKKERSKQEEMRSMGRCYWLPLITKPLHAFRRQQAQIKVKREYNDIESETNNEPPHKKMKLSRNVVHRTPSSIKAVASPALADDLKSSKDILNLMGKIEKKGQKNMRNMSGWKEREKLEVNQVIDMRIKQKKKAAIIQSKKMIEKHQHSLKLAAIKIKTSKHVTPKMKAIKTEGTQMSQISIKKEERSKQRTKKRKHSEMIAENAPNVNSMTTNNNEAQHTTKRIRSKKMHNKEKTTQKTGTYRDYLYLYKGKESLAQLHFECMLQFKRDLIERCVEEEYSRIMELRKKKHNEKKLKHVKIATITKHTHNKFESSTDESTPENALNTHDITKKKKVIQESETSSDESSEAADRIKKKIAIHVNDNDNDYEMMNVHKLRDKLQTLSTLAANNKKKGEDLATPQSPSIIQASYNASTSTSTSMGNNSVNSTPTNSVSASNTNSGNLFPINLPQISFNIQAQAQAQPPPPVIKSLQSQSHYNTQPQHSWYGHQTIHMPLYSAPASMGSIPYQYNMHQHHNNYNKHTQQTPQQLLLSSHPHHNIYAHKTIANNNNRRAFSMNKMPNFDISAPPKQIYCDTVSSLSNTSNTSNISSSHSITSITTATTIVNKEEDIKIKKSKNELISKNGHWIIRKHESGCARSEGFYSLAPSKQRRKHRHLAISLSRNKASKGSRGKETVSSSSIFGENARNLRLHKRRTETSHNYTFRQKNIQFGKSSIHSWGVFALEEINGEECVVEYIGEYITEKYANLREKLYDRQGYDDYMFRVEDDLIIDATKKGNLARFINHSCDPNCYTRIIQVANTPRVVIYSKRIIKAGEELTYDYKFPIEDDKIQCLCGSKNCRGTLN